jgi:hypothetical protein
MSKNKQVQKENYKSSDMYNELPMISVCISRTILDVEIDKCEVAVRGFCLDECFEKLYNIKKLFNK